MLANGALREVKLVESSGDAFIDRLAQQSALSASPYPQPPAEERSSSLRFRLTLKMSQDYL